MQLTFTQVTALAAGRWEQIHRALGVALSTTSHQKHTPCPGCGGKDRFRVTKAYHDTGGFICGGSGDTTGGDGFALLQHVHGWTPGESLRAVARECGLDVEAIYRVRHYLKVGTRPHHHPYLDAKMLTNPHNLIEYKDQLIVTTHNSNGELTGCQKIAADGSKLFLTGQEKKGCWHWLQAPPHRGQTIAVVEGWATGASLVEPEIALDGAVAIAFDAGNIPTVTASLLTLYPSSRIVIFRDFDKAGINAANAAVALDPSRVSVIEPPANAPAWATDWNDYLVFEREKDID